MFENGGLWIEGPGDKTRVIDGVPVSGSNTPCIPNSNLLRMPAGIARCHGLAGVWWPLHTHCQIFICCRCVTGPRYPLPVHLLASSTCTPPPPAPSASAPCTSAFPERVKQRVAGRAVPRALIKCWFSQSVGVDKHVSPAARAPVLAALDLTKDSDLQLLMELLRSERAVACHVAPPCRTSSRAREIPEGPPPLRSCTHPDGVPSLSGLDLVRVTQANLLYKVCAEIFDCCQKGILCTVENPRRSHFWKTRHMSKISPEYNIWSHFHHCMMGSRRRKATLLLHNFPQACCMRLECDGSHEHEPWARTGNNSWATAAETAYPPLIGRRAPS